MREIVEMLERKVQAGGDPTDFEPDAKIKLAGI